MKSDWRREDAGSHSDDESRTVLHHRPMLLKARKVQSKLASGSLHGQPPFCKAHIACTRAN